MHPEDLERCLQIYISSFDARSSFQMEYRLRRFDGDYRWVLSTGGPRFDHNGVFAGYIGSCIDITGVRPTEEDVAKQKLETVGVLAAGIAHDLGNILGGILAHSEVALTEVAGGSSPKEELQRIRAGALRGAEIAQQRTEGMRSGRKLSSAQIAIWRVELRLIPGVECLTIAT